ncbi:hypothetical protein M8J75_010556 [Diaphorina citri]|nr:hypothetical protein M8J75_010556 [Diaphorina citri]KAI5728764.1 hypothetical protein M8J77_020759 [Diaphorina citri]
MNCLPLVYVTVFNYLVCANEHTSHNASAHLVKGHKKEINSLLNRFCNFLQVRTSTGTSARPTHVHSEHFKTDFSILTTDLSSLYLSSEEENTLRDTVRNITRYGFANNRPIDLTLDQLAVNGTAYHDKMVDAMLPDMAKYLVLSKDPGSVTEDSLPFLGD